MLNYDLRINIEDYVDQIGRTGRVGAKRTAITFFLSANAKSWRDLTKILCEAKQLVGSRPLAVAVVVVRSGVVVVGALTVLGAVDVVSAAQVLIV